MAPGMPKLKRDKQQTSIEDYVERGQDEAAAYSGTDCILFKLDAGKRVVIAR